MPPATPRTCPNCNGTGREPCFNCSASGSQPGVTPLEPCRVCNGARYLPCSGAGPH